MIPELKENRPHGTKAYPYDQYFIHGAKHAFQIPVHWHDEFEIIYIKKGQLRVVINQQEYLGAPGSIFFVNPRELHLMGSSDLSVEYYTMLFPLEFISFQSIDDLESNLLQPLRSNQLLVANEVPNEELRKKLFPLLEEIAQINKFNEYFKQLQTRMLLLQVLLELCHTPDMISASASGNTDIQKEMLIYIQEHFTEKLSLQMMSQRFHLSEKYLSRYFKEHFHLPFSNYVSHLRLTLAKQLLEATDLPITEVALRSGFPSVSYFIRSFNGTYGISPLKYRKERIPGHE